MREEYTPPIAEIKRSRLSGNLKDAIYSPRHRGMLADWVAAEWELTKVFGFTKEMFAALDRKGDEMIVVLDHLYNPPGKATRQYEFNGETDGAEKILKGYIFFGIEVDRSQIYEICQNERAATHIATWIMSRKRLREENAVIESDFEHILRRPKLMRAIGEAAKPFPGQAA